MRESGPEVAAVKRRLRARLKQSGYRRSARSRIEVFGSGKPLIPLLARGGLRHYQMPAGAEEVRIVPRGMPAGFIDDSPDNRWLGAQLALVLLDGAWIPLDSPMLADGFHGLDWQRSDDPDL